MRKSKEDAEITRKKLLQAGFKMFFEVGFEKASLEKISQVAGVTRGAAYWHFNNKQGLYEETIQAVLSQMAEEKKKIISDQSVDWKKIIVNLIYLPHQMRKEFQFIEKSVLFLSHDDGFIEIKAKIEKAKQQLYTYFLEEVQKREKVNDECFKYKAEEIATMLYVMCEGMYSCGIPESIDRTITKLTIENCVDMIFK